jgi:hypothetical protein
MAPHGLNDEETEVWAAVVNNMSAEWFNPSNVPLLIQYCHHTVQARRIAELLEQALSDKNLSVRDYEKLLKMQARESMTLCSLATKMRVAQQSTLHDTARQKDVHGSARKPWQS